jgi:hypothetical protein
MWTKISEEVPLLLLPVQLVHVQARHRIQQNHLSQYKLRMVAHSVADPDPGSGAFYPKDLGFGSGMIFFPGSRIPNMTKIKFYVLKFIKYKACFLEK